MKTYIDCIPCFIRQALAAARLATDDAAVHEQVVREVLTLASELDLAQTPPVASRLIYRRVRELTGIDDPYRAEKQRFNRLALELYPDLSEKIRSSADPLGLAVRLAVTGNVIDLGANGGLTEADVHDSLDRIVSEPLIGDIEAFRDAVNRAASILYVADNAGEIVFDRLLIEQLPMRKVTLSVRGRPIINDAMLEDAAAAGLCDLVEVIDDGSDAPGAVLAECPPVFRERFAHADMIIAKGQGNFETLSEEQGNTFFLLKAKCAVIARHIGQPEGAHLLLSKRDVPSR